MSSHFQNRKGVYKDVKLEFLVVDTGKSNSPAILGLEYYKKINVVNRVHTIEIEN